MFLARGVAGAGRKEGRKAGNLAIIPVLILECQAACNTYSEVALWSP